MVTVPCANIRKGGEFCGSCWYCLERLRKTERGARQAALSPKGCDTASHRDGPASGGSPGIPPGPSRRGLGWVEDLASAGAHTPMPLKHEWLAAEAKKRKGKR